MALERQGGSRSDQLSLSMPLLGIGTVAPATCSKGYSWKFFRRFFEVLHVWYLGNPSSPSYIGALNLEYDDDGISLHYSPAWLIL